MSTNYEFDKLQRAYTELAQQHQIDAQRLLLVGDVPSEPSGKGMAPRPPPALMRRYEANRDDVSYPYHLKDHDQVQREPENEVDESQHGAGQPSSIAPIPSTDTGIFHENSNNLIEMSFIPPPIHFLIQSFIYILFLVLIFLRAGRD